MKNKERNLVLFLSAFMLLFLLIPTFFAFPTADDFCYAIMRERYGFFADEEYMMTNGRWASALVLHADGFLVNHLSWYRLFPSIGIGLLICSMYIFIINANIQARKLKNIILSVFLAAIALTFLPGQSQILFWFTGAANYLTAVIVSLLAWSALLRYSDTGKKSYLVIGIILIFLSASFNEISLFSQPFILWIIFRNRQRRNKIFIFSLLVLFVALLIFLLSPGNQIRHNSFSIRYSSLGFWRDMILQSGRFVLYTIVLMTGLLWLFYGKLPDKKSVAKITALLIPVIISVVLPFVTTGILGQHRTPAFAWLLVFPVFFAVISENSGPINFHPGKRYLFLLLILLHPNILTTTNDLVSGKFQHFSSEMKNCMELKMADPDCQCHKNTSIPYSLENIYPLDDSARFRNACLEVYIKENKL